METPRVVTSVPKLAPLTTVTPSPQADKSRVSPYMQLPGVVGVDHFVEYATGLRCKETGSHALTCSLQYEYPIALILDPKGFCLQTRFNTQPPKPSNYGLEPYMYYPIRGMVAYQFQQQPGKASRCRYLHKIGCTPLPFNARWRRQPQYTVTIMPLLTRVKRTNYIHWKKCPHPPLIPVGMSL